MRLINQAVENFGLLRRFTLAEFTEICHSLPNDRLELVNGEILWSAIPDSTHIEQTMQIESLLQAKYAEVRRIGCHVAGSYAWYSVNRELDGLWAEAIVEGSDYVCPDVSICFLDYLKTGCRPPALLVVEVISVSHRSEIDRDLISKPYIYASLEIPTYWVVDRRDQSVWVHTAPDDGKYTRRAQYKRRKKLPAPGLEFLTITPDQIFS